MHPAAPSIVWARIALAGFAKTELARQLEVPGRLLRNERNGIEPGHADLKDALTCADLDLLTLERSIEGNLRFAPPTTLHQHARAQRSSRAAFERFKRMFRPRLITAMHEQLAERETHVLRHAVPFAVELGKRPFAHRHHVGAPRVTHVGDDRKCERPTPF